MRAEREGPYAALRSDVEDVFALVASEARRREGWHTSIAHGALAVQVRDPGDGSALFRCPLDFPDIPPDAAGRCLLARSRGKEFNEFVTREDLFEELPELYSPGYAFDPDGLGYAAVYEQSAYYFGFTIDTLMLFVSRRLPNGMLALKMPVARDEEGRWTVRNCHAKIMALSGMCVEPAMEGGCSIVVLHHTRNWLMSYLPAYLNVQIVSRIFAKILLHTSKLLMVEYAAERAARGFALCPGSFSPAFASGSAGVPPRWRGCGLALPPDPPSPFVLHNRPPAPGPRDANSVEATHAMFFGLLGIGVPPHEGEEPPPSPVRSEESAGSPGPAPCRRPAQVIHTCLGLHSSQQPCVQSRVGEAMRVSLDISLRIESMTLGELGPPSSPPWPDEAAPPAAEDKAGEERVPAAPAAAPSRRRGQAEAEAEGEGEVPNPPRRRRPASCDERPEAAGEPPRPKRPGQRRRQTRPPVAQNGFIQFCRERKNELVRDQPGISSRAMASMLGGTPPPPTASGLTGPARAVAGGGAGGAGALPRLGGQGPRPRVLLGAQAAAAAAGAGGEAGGRGRDDLRGGLGPLGPGLRAAGRALAALQHEPRGVRLLMAASARIDQCCSPRSFPLSPPYPSSCCVCQPWDRLTYALTRGLPASRPDHRMANPIFTSTPLEHFCGPFFVPAKITAVAKNQFSAAAQHLLGYSYSGTPGA